MDPTILNGLFAGAFGLFLILGMYLGIKVKNPWFIAIMVVLFAVAGVLAIRVYNDVYTPKNRSVVIRPADRIPQPSETREPYNPRTPSQQMQDAIEHNRSQQ